MPPSPAAASAMAAVHESASVTSHSMARVPAPASFGGVDEALMPAGQQGDLGASLGQPDSDAATEPARGSHDYDSHRSPELLDE